MRVVNGYVFFPTVKRIEVGSRIFGAPIIESRNLFYTKGNKFDNFELNGLNPFKSEEDAREAISHAQENHQITYFKRPITLALLNMKIAESRQEALSFPNGSLVVIEGGAADICEKVATEWEKRIFGPKVNGREMTYNGVVARFTKNGFRKFNRLGGEYETGTALYAAREIKRQGDDPRVEIAILDLRRIT